MITLVKTIPDPTTHIIDPIASQTARKIIKDLDLTAVMGEAIYANSDYSAPMQTSDANGNPIFNNENRFTYEIVVNMNPQNMRWEMLDKPEFRQSEIESRCPVFFEPVTGTYLTEYVQATGLTLNCNIHISNCALAYEVLDRLYMRYRNGMLVEFYDYLFDYPIPGDIFGTLFLINKLKGFPSETFYQFLQIWSHSTIGLSINKLKEDKRELVIKHMLTKVKAQLDCSVEKPEPDKVNQATNAWNIPFTVTMQFMRPRTLFLRYPIIIENQMVPGEAVPMIADDYHPYDPARSPFFDQEHYRQLTEGQLSTVDCVRLPWYDSWDIPATMPHNRLGYVPFAMIAFTLDNTDDPTGETVIDLKELGDAALVPEVIAEIESKAYDPLVFNGLYNISVFSNDNLVEPASIVVDPDHPTVLHIKNRRKDRVYRLVLSVNKDRFYGTFNTIRVFTIDFVVSRPKFK